MLKLILLLNPVYVTLFWAAVLSFYSVNRGAPKAFLGKFMVVAFVLYLSHFLYFQGYFNIYRFIDGVYTLAMLLVFPMYHIYIRLLTVDRMFSVRKHYIYLLIPFVIFIIHTIILSSMSAEEHISFFTKVVPGFEKAEGAQLYMWGISHIARFIFVAQVFYYLIINFNLLFKHSRRVKNFYSNIEGMQLHWVQFINISLAITSVASILLALAGREAFADSAMALVLPSLVFSFMLFFIGLLGNTQQAVRTSDTESEDEQGFEEETQSEIKTNGSNQELKKKMENLFEKDKIFQNPDLKIWDVSKLLGTNRTYVSRLINTEYNKNFCNHVNHYRVQYAKEILKQNPELTNEQVAEMAGFGSLNSLYRAFSTLEGIHLSQYRKENP